MEPQIPTPEGATNREEVNAILKPLRTYERDIAEMIRNNQVSASSVNLAEKRRDEAREQIKIEAVAREKAMAESGGIDTTQPIRTPLSIVMPTGPQKIQPIIIVQETPVQRTALEILQDKIENPEPVETPYVVPVQNVPSKESSFYILHEQPTIAPTMASRKEYFAPQEERRSHTALFTVLSIFLIFVGIGILVWLYFLRAENPVVKTHPVVISTFLPTNQEKVFDIGGLSIVQTSLGLSAFLDNAYPKDSITQIKTTAQFASTTDTNADGLNADIFFESFAPHIPSSLTRAFNKKMFAGIYTLDKNHAFFIIQIDSFDRAFAGMLAWEKNMYADLSPFINKKEEVEATLDASGDVITKQNTAVALGSFEDEIVQNKDARALKNNQGETLVIYSFIDQKTLFIVDNEDTFKETLKRFEASKLLK